MSVAATTAFAVAMRCRRRLISTAADTVCFVQQWVVRAIIVRTTLRLPPPKRRIVTILRWGTGLTVRFRDCVVERESLLLLLSLFRADHRSRPIRRRRFRDETQRMLQRANLPRLHRLQYSQIVYS